MQSCNQEQGEIPKFCKQEQARWLDQTLKTHNTVSTDQNYVSMGHLSYTKLQGTDTPREVKFSSAHLNTIDAYSSCAVGWRALVLADDPGRKVLAIFAGINEFCRWNLQILFCPDFTISWAEGRRGHTVKEGRGKGQPHTHLDVRTIYAEGGWGAHCKIINTDKSGWGNTRTDFIWYSMAM